MPKLWNMALACIMALATTLVLPDAALAAGGHHPTIPGPELSAVWVIPFVCMLLSIAIMPLAAPHFWEHHFGKISVFWGLAFLIPCWLVYGFSTALYKFLPVSAHHPAGLCFLYHSALRPLYRGGGCDGIDPPPRES